MVPLIPAIRANHAGAGSIDGCRPPDELTNAPWASRRKEKTMVATPPGNALGPCFRREIKAKWTAAKLG
jgi:hypothetical protein